MKQNNKTRRRLKKVKKYRGGSSKYLIFKKKVFNLLFDYLGTLERLIKNFRIPLCILLM